MNAVEAVFRLVPSVPSNLCSRDDLTLAFTADAPVAVALTPVDNATNDGFYVLPSSGVIAGPDPGSGANRAPDGTIVAPAGDLTIQEGQSVFFEGQASDPDGDALGYSWDFGDTISSTALIPANHTYTDSGTYTVTFTATDTEGQAYAEIVNVRSSQQPSRDRIEPGNPSTSYLYLKILGDASISGSRMPRGAPALSQALKDLLRDWIERGAPND